MYDPHGKEIEARRIKEFNKIVPRQCGMLSFPKSLKGKN
jgi:hypothetical protein